MTVFEQLLEVQEHDTAVDRLRHQRAHLPERLDLAALQKRNSELHVLMTEVRARLDAVEQRQATMEADATLLGQRIREIETRMYSGEVSATRDLLAMTAEIQALQVRRSSLEDEALAAMEEAEPLAEQIATFEAETAVLSVQAAGLRSTITAAEADIDEQIRLEEQHRNEVAQQVPVELLSTYEKLRGNLGGVGAARLMGISCSGCHLTLPASEVARLKREPPDALVLCDQCGRILVR